MKYFVVKNNNKKLKNRGCKLGTSGEYQLQLVSIDDNLSPDPGKILKLIQVALPLLYICCLFVERSLTFDREPHRVCVRACVNEFEWLC